MAKCDVCGEKVGILGAVYVLVPGGKASICEKCQDYKMKGLLKDATADDKKAVEDYFNSFNDTIYKDEIEKYINTMYARAQKNIESTSKEEHHLSEAEIKKVNDQANYEDILKKIKINFKGAEPIYSLLGSRGKYLQVYENKVVISVISGFDALSKGGKVARSAVGSILTNNSTDGVKVIYYSDVIGLQFKKPGISLGYLQLETAASLGDNNMTTNFFNENTFPFDVSFVSNELMEEVFVYIEEKVAETK